MSDCTMPCDCCEGVAVATPAPVANRPGLPALRYRVGTHSSFRASMVAGLADLSGLTTRDPGDPSIALLDAWATLADVLTFYQERIANEGYLRTATELRSVLALARLVGYEPRPGVAADTHLAFELEPGHDEVVARGTRVQSVPGPGQLPQVYETSEPLAARAAFNTLAVRRSRPQALTLDRAEATGELWLAGIGTRLQPNDAVAVVVGDDARLRFVERVEEDAAGGRTRVVFQGAPRKPRPWAKYTKLDTLLAAVAAGESAPAKHDPTAPAGARSTDTRLRLAQLFKPDLAGVVYRAWANAAVAKPTKARVYAMRVRASLFGANAPRKPRYVDGRIQPADTWFDWDQNDQGATAALPEDERTIYLDNPYPNVRSGSIVAVWRRGAPPPPPTIARASSSADTGHDDEAVDPPTFHGLKSPLAADVVARNAYGISAKTTRIVVEDDDRWKAPTRMEALRNTVVFADSEELALAEEPVTADVCRGTLELAELYEGMEPGRTLVVAGERADIPGVRGVTAAEVVTVAEVRQGAAGGEGSPQRGERNRTFLVLAGGGLRRCYRRETVVVYGNVVHATHGETKSEVLGGGDARLAHQAFTLRANPLTFVSAATPSGVESSLEVRVDDVRWPEVPSFVGLAPADRGYLARADEARVTTVVFPGGVEGRRLPSGVENVRARFRAGIGRAGNAPVGALSLPVDKPLAVRGVVNPVPATGGADAEGRDETREHAPLPLKALDRLVSVADYGWFARTFAGVGKATADRLPVGSRFTVVVTVAGVDGALLDADGGVVRNLRRALRRFGDPSLPVKVLVAERLVLDLAARVRLHPDHQWAAVEPALRAELVERFGFARREPAADLVPSAVVAAVHDVAGVASAVIERMAAVSEADPDPDVEGVDRLRARGARVGSDGVVVPAQHLYVAPELPELLVLREDKA